MRLKPTTKGVRPKLTKGDKQRFKRQLEAAKPQLIELVSKLPEIMEPYKEWQYMTGAEYLKLWRATNPDTFPETFDKKGKPTRFELNDRYRVQLEGMKPKDHYRALIGEFELGGWDRVDKYMQRMRLKFSELKLKIESKSETQKHTSSERLEEK